MQQMTDLYNKIVELKKQRLEIASASISDKKKNYINDLRKISKAVAKLSEELHHLRKAKK